MTHIDFNARAELFLGSDIRTAAEQGPRTFRTAAQAIRFALEEVAPVSLRGALLRIGSQNFSRHDLPKLYRSAEFPLPRKRGQVHVNRGEAAAA
jgi:hypothetical protein